MGVLKANVDGTWVDLTIGAPGPTGPKGDTGATGATGPQGAASTVPGPVGPQGIQGIQGATGATGATGPTGTTGAQGIQGVKGDTGLQGPQGIQGVKGDTGAAGTNGLITSVVGSTYISVNSSTPSAPVVSATGLLPLTGGTLSGALQVNSSLNVSGTSTLGTVNAGALTVSTLNVTAPASGTVLKSRAQNEYFGSYMNETVDVTYTDGAGTFPYATVATFSASAIYMAPDRSTAVGTMLYTNDRNSPSGGGIIFGDVTGFASGNVWVYMGSLPFATVWIPPNAAQGGFVLRINGVQGGSTYYQYIFNLAMTRYVA